METTKDTDVTSPAKPGRPVGSTNKFSVHARKWAEDTGELPHEILLKMARGTPIRRKVKEVDPFTKEVTWREEWVTPNLDQMIDCAKAAAPYFAPKFGNIEFQRNLSDDELLQLFEFYSSRASRPDTGGGDATPESSPPENTSTGGETETPRRRRLLPGA